MSLVGNIIWLIFGGFFAALGYMIGGLVLCLTIIGIPFGMQSIQLGIAVLAPFGKTVERKPSGEGCLAVGFNVIWVILAGWLIALTHVVFGIVLGITIIGLPFAKQHLKLAQIAFLPFTYRLE